MSLKILGIETSCDDSSIAVLSDQDILANITYTQKIHQKYGGVVPEWASRKHLEAMVPLMQEVLETSGISIHELNAIAITQGPGLMGSLLVGIGFAKGLSLSTGLPLISVNHLEAHVMSLLIDEPKLTFPFICLTVSGGHTQLILVKDIGDLTVLGSTIDDAAGEAFDKIGKLLGLPFPGGPHLDKLAQSGEVKFKFPVTKLKNHNFSFSGLKTAVLVFLQKNLKENPNFISENLNDLCASVQDSIIQMLCIQLIDLSKKYKITNIGIAGGVSANQGLRQRINQLKGSLNWKVKFPQLQYCTDNAAMIATVGYYKYLKNDFAPINFSALSRFPIQEI